MHTDTKKLTTSGLLCAFAYVVMLVSKLIPEVAGFLQLDLKDTVIVMGGFILGPAYALIISVVVALVEMVTVSNTGFIGLIMNIISTVAFCCTAALIYNGHRTFKGAVGGLVAGAFVLTVVMLLWNVFITPLYMEVPREVVIKMLPSVFLPFNLVKGFINTALALVLYRPLVKALARAGLANYAKNNRKKSYISLATGLAILAVSIPVFLYLLGVI